MEYYFCNTLSVQKQLESKGKDEMAMTTGLKLLNYCIHKLNSITQMIYKTIYSDTYFYL